MKLWLVVWIVCLIATGIAFSTSEPIDLRMIAVVPFALFGWIPVMRNFMKAKTEERVQNESD